MALHHLLLCRRLSALDLDETLGEPREHAGVLRARLLRLLRHRSGLTGNASHLRVQLGHLLLVRDGEFLARPFNLRAGIREFAAQGLDLPLTIRQRARMRSRECLGLRLHGLHPLLGFSQPRRQRCERRRMLRGSLRQPPLRLSLGLCEPDSKSIEAHLLLRAELLDGLLVAALRLPQGLLGLRL